MNHKIATQSKRAKSFEEKEKEDVQKATADLEKAKKEVRNLAFALDTNILIIAYGNNRFQRDAIAEIASQNQTFVCDTVYWEFLRNCGLEKFRERHHILTTNNLLHPLSEYDDAVKKTYQNIWVTYLAHYKNEPKKMSTIKIPDLWIVAAVAQKGIDKILTSDESDFPDGLFTKEKYYLGKDTSIILATFNRIKANQLLLDAQRNGITVDIRSLCAT